MTEGTRLSKKLRTFGMRALEHQHLPWWLGALAFALASPAWTTPVTEQRPETSHLALSETVLFLPENPVPLT